MEPDEPVELELRRALQDLPRKAMAAQKIFPLSEKSDQYLNTFEIDWTKRLKNDRHAELRGAKEVGSQQGKDDLINAKYDQLLAGLKQAVDNIEKGQAADLTFTMMERDNREPPSKLSRDEIRERVAAIDRQRELERKDGIEFDG